MSNKFHLKQCWSKLPTPVDAEKPGPATSNLPKSADKDVDAFYWENIRENVRKRTKAYFDRALNR